MGDFFFAMEGCNGTTTSSKGCFYGTNGWLNGTGGVTTGTVHGPRVRMVLKDASTVLMVAQWYRKPLRFEIQILLFLRSRF